MSLATVFWLECCNERPLELSAAKIRDVRRLTAPRTRAITITENASVPAARNTSSAISMVLLSRVMSLIRVPIVSTVRS